MISVRNISFNYGKNCILKDISFDIRNGECVGILGNNGAGKSTLITCINRIHSPKSGNVIIDDKNVSEMSRLDIAKNISYVAQRQDTAQMTVFDFVLLGRKPYIKWSVTQKDLDICDEVLSSLSLSRLKLRSIEELSGGEVQKVTLARALVQEPRLLLLDEPTSNLDPKNQYEMMHLIRSITKQRGICSVVVMHDLSLALRYCDKFLFLKNGNVYAYGDASVVTNEAIKAVYGIEAQVEVVGGKSVVVIG